MNNRNVALGVGGFLVCIIAVLALMQLQSRREIADARQAIEAAQASSPQGPPQSVTVSPSPPTPLSPRPAQVTVFTPPPLPPPQRPDLLGARTSSSNSSSSGEVENFLRALFSIEQQRRQVKQEAGAAMARINRAFLNAPLNAVQNWDNPDHPTGGAREEPQLAAAAMNVTETTVQRLESLLGMLARDPAPVSCARLRSAYTNVLQSDLALSRLNVQSARVLVSAVQDDQRARAAMGALKQIQPQERHAGQQLRLAVQAANREMMALRGDFPQNAGYFTLSN